MDTLYLLGNGFDLACKLRSRYSDYFNNRFSKFLGFNPEEPTALESLRKEFQANGRWNIPSAWFFIFAYYHDSNEGCASTWKDVESNIEEFVCDAELIDRMDPNKEIDNDSQIEIVGDRPSAFRAVDSVVLYLQDKHESFKAGKNGRIDRTARRKILLEELKDFETDFRAYMRLDAYEPTDSLSDYEQRANKLFNEIRWAAIPQGVRNSAPDDNNEYALSFNFTNPWNEELLSSMTVANVHGSTLYGNAFFGIGDVEQFMKEKANEAYDAENRDVRISGMWKREISSVSRFTKAERSLSLSVAGNDTKLDSVFEKLQSSNGLHVIKFFGLSLGEADYPYLKQYFDKAHITKANEGMNSFLGFYYTEGQDKDDLINSIDMLLRRYSDDTGYRPVGGLMRELLYTHRLDVQKLHSV